MKGRSERRIEAYQDGALGERERARVERDLAASPLHEGHLEDTRRLGAIVRGVWNEGPPAPSLDRILPALRREMARVDAQREAASPWRRGLLAWREAFSFVPAGAVAAAAVVAAVYLWPAAEVPRDLLRAEAPSAQRSAVARVAVSPQAQGLAARDSAVRSVTWTGAPVSAHVPSVRPPGAAESPSSVYDVAQGETPLMLFQAEDGSMVIWLLEEDDLSHAIATKGRA
jgi:hypothetical protein